MSANRVEFYISGEAANAVTAHAHLRSAATRGGRAKVLGRAEVVDMYLSSDAVGDTPVDAAALGVAVTASEGKLINAPSDADNHFSWKIRSGGNGNIIMALTNAGDANITAYLNVILANGTVLTSPAITFVDNTP